MKKVGSTILKNSLNSYLKEVRRGGRFLVTDRGEPIAKLVPINDGPSESSEVILAELSNRGNITISDQEAEKRLRHKPPITIKLEGISASDLLLQDRDR